jgi:hypothetical protein
LIIPHLVLIKILKASIGKIPISIGSQALCAHDTIRTRGFKFFFCASFELIKSNIAAPSLIPLAFPAVTVPSSLFKAVSRFLKFLGLRLLRI